MKFAILIAIRRILITKNTRRKTPREMNETESVTASLSPYYDRRLALNSDRIPYRTRLEPFLSRSIFRKLPGGSA